MSSARTERQKNASRTNGAQSNGPVTGEGKLRSSQNSTTHGIFSKKVIIEGESDEEFQQLAESINARWSPATEEEQEAVRELILLRWRIRRASMVETKLLTAAGGEGDPGAAKEMFKTMDNVSRYQGRLRRLESTGEQRLREIQEARISKEQERAEQETKHERDVAEYRQYAKRVLLHRCILKDPLEKTQTVEEILGVDEVPVDRDVVEALLAQIIDRYNQECYERAASRNRDAA
jgi:hypothetical protein